MRFCFPLGALLALFVLSSCATSDLPPLPPTEVEGQVYELKAVDVRPQKLALTRKHATLPPGPHVVKGRWSYYEPVWNTDIYGRLTGSSIHVFTVNVYESLAGEMEVEFVVDENGRVAAVKVLRATHPEIAQKVCRTIASWNFTPAEKGGKLVKVRLRQIYNYGKQ